MVESMKTIKAIKHIIGYEQKGFIDEILQTIDKMEKAKLEVDIQYSFANEKYTALIVGRKVETNGNNRSGKTIR